MKFQVKILEKAEADAASIVAFIYERSPQGAGAWLDAYRAARLWLGDHADACGLATEARAFDIEVKQALFKTKKGRTYRLLFTMVGNEARILRVHGPGQAPVTPKEI